MERGKPATSSYPHIHRAYYYDYNHIKPGRRILTYYYVISCLDKGVHPTFFDYFQQPVAAGPYYQKFGAAESKLYYLARLNEFWELLSRTNGWVGGTQPDRLVGWIPWEATKGGALGGPGGIADARWFPFGKGRVTAVVAFESSGLSGDAMAHELGHLLDSSGLRHAPNDESFTCEVPWLTDGQYPRYQGYPKGSIGVTGVRIGPDRTELLDPASYYDMMTYCENRWISPHNYGKLAAGFAPTGQDGESSVQLASPQRQLLVSGIVNSSPPSATLDSAWSITSTVQTEASSGSAYCWELRDAAGQSLDSRCFDLAFTDRETGEQLSADWFTMVIPYPMGTQFVVLSRLGAELARLGVSPNAPLVRVVEPNGGEVWGRTGTYTVTWTASDADGDALRFIVSYSGDGGNTWMPLAIDVVSRSLPVDVGRLPGSVNARLKIEASDGMLIGEDISDADFVISRKAPEPVILSLSGNVTLPGQTPAVLEGYAYDPEDGKLGDEKLTWTSNRDGVLGTGRWVLTELSDGDHVITLRAMDSDGNTGTVSVNVKVGYSVYLPLVTKAYGSPALTPTSTPAPIQRPSPLATMATTTD